MKYCKYSYVFVIIALVFSFVSCKPYKNIIYFSDLPDSVKTYTTRTVTFKNPLIKPDDLLYVNIQTLDPEANALFAASNTPISSVGANSLTLAGNQISTGHLVDKDGSIDLPVIGKVKVEGYTTQKARDTIEYLVEKYYTSSTVDVRYNNFKITVIGEVNRPSTFTIPNEEVTILDALGLAGDLTIYGKRENVLLIRKDTGDVKQLVRLNLNSKDLINSPYFFLRQNDVIYVEPDKSKAIQTDAYRTRNITIAVSLVSLLVVIASRVR